MSILAWIEDQKRLKLLNAPKYVNPASDSSKGLWTRCDKCGVILYIKHLKENQRVCFGCSYHLQMSSQERVENLLDKESWRPLDETVSPCDPLEFHDQKDYTDRLQEAQERTGLQDAIQTGSGRVDGIPVALGVMDFEFMGGSMGSVVGEKVTRLIEYATQEGLTLVLVCASGGARMQEGVFSLMQMAKISSALQVYQTCANLLYISILTSPTTGGVTASFAMLGDIIFAEPKALIAFAGRRVIEQTLCEDLPEDFQTSEYMLHHGLCDLIVPRRFLRQALSESIRLYKNAPFKKPGRIPFGIQNPITFLVEEKVRRRYIHTDSDDRAQKISVTPTETSNYQVRESGNDSNSNNAGLIKTGKITLSQAPSTSVPTRVFDDTGVSDNFALNSVLSTSLKRETYQYRNILTSFRTMFNLFSKQLAIPYSSSENRYSSSNKESRIAQGVNKILPEQVHAEAGFTSFPANSLPSIKESEFNLQEQGDQAAESDLLLQNFMALSENQDLGERLSSASKSLPSGSYPPLRAGAEGSDSVEREQISLSVSGRNNTSNGANRDKPATQKETVYSSETDGSTGSTEVSRAGIFNAKETISSNTAPNRSVSNHDWHPTPIDFLNQSIELAATQGVEWRAFYVHQKISQTTGFIEDFLQSNQDTNQLALQNTLFYRSICRNTN